MQRPSVFAPKGGQSLPWAHLPESSWLKMLVLFLPTVVNSMLLPLLTPGSERRMVAPPGRGGMPQLPRPTAPCGEPGCEERRALMTERPVLADGLYGLYGLPIAS